MVPTDAFVVTWSPVAGVLSYFVEVTNEETNQVLRLGVDPSETSFEVPSSWLQAGVSHEVTVAAVSAATGNVASNQVVVTTEP